MRHKEVEITKSLKITKLVKINNSGSYLGMEKGCFVIKNRSARKVGSEHRRLHRYPTMSFEEDGLPLRR